MLKLTIKEIKNLTCDLKGKYHIYLDQALDNLMYNKQEDHAKSYMEIWNTTKYDETVEDITNSLNWLYNKALDKITSGSENWKATWLRVAKDVMKIKIDLLDIKLDHVVSESLSKYIDKALKDLK